MAVLVLAAGSGARLYPLTDEMPKSIIDINGKTMLHETLKYLDMFNSTGKVFINEVIICVGFQRKKIYDYLSKLTFNGLNITLIENPLYSHLNNNFSVWLSKSHLLGKEFILINGDIFYESHILKKVFESNLNNFSIVDTTKPLPEDGMKVLISEEDNLIRAFSKTFYEGHACTVGIHKFSEQGSVNFFEALQEQLEKGINSFHHSAIDKIIKNGAYKHHALDIKGLKWCEVDDMDDLKVARRISNEL